MTNKKYNLFRYIAGTLFVVQALVVIIGNHGIGYGNILPIIADAVMAVSLFTKKDRIFLVGLAANILNSIRLVIHYIGLQRSGYYSASFFISFIFVQIVCIVAYVLLFVALLPSKPDKKLGIFSIIILLARGFIPTYYGRGFLETILSSVTSGIFYAILPGIPMALAVIAIQNAPHSQPVVRAKKKAPDLTVGEELTKLKELLDMGAITQEEFDQKKKHLLDGKV